MPAPVDWVPLLTMSLMVGLFEAIFFRGFIQTRLSAGLGLVPGIVTRSGAIRAPALLIIAYFHTEPVNEQWAVRPDMYRS